MSASRSIRAASASRPSKSWRAIRASVNRRDFVCSNLPMSDGALPRPMGFSIGWTAAGCSRCDHVSVPMMQCPQPSSASHGASS